MKTTTIRISITAIALGVSGAVSMVYELAWTRALALVIGSSTYAFTSMLVAFLVGIAGGSALYSWRLGAVRASPVTFGPDQVHWTPLRHWRSPLTGVSYPVEWKVRVGGRTIALQALMDDQENDARGSTGTLYWEGAVRVLDDAGRPIGRGYLELTGYGRRVSF